MVNFTVYNSYEILDKVSKAKTKKEKIDLLRKEDNNWALKDILRGAYDDAVVWILPTGRPPFEPASEESHPSSWSKHNKKLANFVKGGPGEKIKSYQREKMFLDILETVHPKDAELLVMMINKKLKVKGITKKLVQEAFPNLILR
tara:strand:- start:103 stop:537 length:435 start_codon:yes stop_codon:yes gene_type:complete